MARLVSGEFQFKVTGPDEITQTTNCVVNVLGRDWEMNAGDKGDLMSYPWIASPLYDPFEGALGSGWHDKRYRLGDVTRKEADKGWYDLVIVGETPETRMPVWKARLGYCGLRAGGWVAWNNHRRKDNK